MTAAPTPALTLTPASDSAKIFVENDIIAQAAARESQRLNGISLEMFRRRCPEPM